MGRGSKVHASSWKRTKSRGRNVQLGEYSQEGVTYLKVAEKVGLKRSHHKKEIVTNLLW